MEGTLAPVAEMGVLSRLLNVFISPSRTFESVARKPGWDWLVPIALLAVSVLVYSVVSTPKADVDGFVQQLMEKIEARRPLGEADREKIEEGIRKQFAFSASALGRAVGTALVLVPVFLVPLFYHGIAAAFGKATRYRQVLAGYAYVQPVHVLYWLLTAAVCVPRSKIDIVEAQLFLLLKSNVGAFLNPESTSLPLIVLLSHLDVFALWGVWLGALALSRTSGLTLKGATWTVGGLWGLWILLKVALATIQSALGM